MFAITEIVVLDVQVRREAQTISLSEIPLVLGLLFAPPGAVVLGRLLGPLTVFVTHRQSPPLKIAYNVVQQTTSAAVASAVYVVVSGPAAFPDPRALGALYLATAVAALTDGIALRVVIGLYEGVLRLRDLLTEAVTYPPISLMVATFGIVAGYALQHDPMSVYPLLACVGIVLLGYRAYAALSGRHLSLERLYQFSQALSETPEVDHVLSEALGRAKDLLRADLAEILFLASEGSAAALVSLDAGDRLHRRTVTTDILPAGMRSALVVDGGTVLIPRRSKDAEHKAYLGERGFRDAILAPLRGEAGVTAVLTVADRMGDVRSFDESDVLLLETVANHAGVALQNGRLIDQLRHQALHDGLTGLPNRVFITRRIAEALVGVEDDGAPGVAAMIMDLDGFKEVNDTLGHQHGDRLLVEVAERLRTAGGDEALVARLGGDEFAVLLPNCPDLEYAAQIGQRLLQSLELPVHLDDLDVAVGASLGVAIAPLHANDGPSLLKRADVAMYAAKAATGGLSVYDAGLDTRTPQRLALASELRQALQRDELVVFVQPKSRLIDGAIVGAEALVRWEHPRHGLIGPDDFVPVAERSGLVRQLTATVLDQALAVVPAWLAAGHELGVAVNLSPRNLLDPDLVDDVARTAAPPPRAAAPAHPRDHRGQRHGRPGRHDRRAPHAAAHGRAPVGGRLRHRLLVAVLPQAAARRRGEDRQELRAEHGPRRRQQLDRALDRRPRGQPLARRRSAEGIETPRGLGAAVGPGLRLRPGASW
jgi:diguanylate cyclase (GGDEF)-like protein